MDANELRVLCEQMSSPDLLESMEGAQKVINSTSDAELRTEYTTLITAYQTAEEMEDILKAFDAIVNHIKKQYTMIYLQGFVMGKSYQEQLFKEAVLAAQIAQAEAADKAKEGPEDEKNDNSDEESA